MGIVSCLLFVLVPFGFSVSYCNNKIGTAVFGSMDTPLSGVAVVVLSILLLLSGILGAVIGSIAWIVAMRSFFEREEMRKLIVYGGRIPVLEELLLKVWQRVYR